MKIYIQSHIQILFSPIILINYSPFFLCFNNLYKILSLQIMSFFVSPSLFYPSNVNLFHLLIGTSAICIFCDKKKKKKKTTHNKRS